jgi:hypothetical protein
MIKRPPVFKRFIHLSVFLLLSLFPVTAFSKNLFSQKNVLIINSYHPGFTWSDNILSGIQSVFKQSNLNIETFIRFIDAKRIPLTKNYIDSFKKMFKEGYDGTSFDSMIVSDNDAFEFIKRYHDELFPKTPVVFCGINDFHDAMLAGRTDMTGVIEKAGYRETFDLIQNLLPKVKTFVFVTDQTTTGHAMGTFCAVNDQ